MNFRGERSSREQEEISRLRQQLRRANQKVAYLEQENQMLRQNRGMCNHTLEGMGNFQEQHLSLVDDEKRYEGLSAGYPPHSELPNLEDEEFCWNYLLLYGEDDDKQMTETDTLVKDDTLQEEDDEKKHNSEPPDELGCFFCSRTIISEDDLTEHYKHCPEYNRWTPSENNSFYSPHFCASSYSSNHSPMTGLHNKGSY